VEADQRSDTVLLVTAVTVKAVGTEGGGVVIFTVAAALLAGLAVATAATVTVPEAGMLSGAVYMPPAEMVPTLVLPPGVPLTCQVTWVLLVLATVAEKSCVDASGTLTVVGLMATEMSDDELPLLPLLPPLLQAASMATASNMPRERLQSDASEE
jgi:hypothetical protein